MSSTRLLDALAWYGLLAATVVPPLVTVGYPFLSFEVVLFAGLTAVPAVLLAYIVNSRSWIAGLLCAAVVSTYVVLYFGRIIPGVLAGAAAGAFTVLALRNPQVSLRISAFSLTIAALGAAPTPNSLFLKGGSSLSSSRSVIHIVLDEQSSEWGVPPNLVPASTRAVLSSFYLERGFTYFERSYTLDSDTHVSVARILNPSLSNPGTAAEFDNSKGTWALNRADLWKAISSRLRLDILETCLLVSAPVGDNPNVVRLEFRDARRPYPAVKALGLGHGDRALIALASAAGVFQVTKVTGFLAGKVKGIGWDRLVPLITAFDERLETISAVEPVASAEVIDDWISRLSTDGGRGTYYFAHFLLPHFPYVFTSHCGIKSPLEWMGGLRYTKAPRSVRYPLYVEQVLCTQAYVDRILRAIDGNTNLRDAVVIIHGDHGSRIDYNDRIEERGSIGESERDWRAALLAVRIPGLQAKRVAQPAPIHETLRKIVDSDFTQVDFPQHSQLDDPILLP